MSMTEEHPVPEPEPNPEPAEEPAESLEDDGTPGAAEPEGDEENDDE
jgi:hypothetical protein